MQSILAPSRDPGAFGVFQTVFDIPRGEPLDALFARLQAPLLLLWGIRDPWINAAGRRAQAAGTGQHREEPQICRLDAHAHGRHAPCPDLRIVNLR